MISDPGNKVNDNTLKDLKAFLNTKETKASLTLYQFCKVPTVTFVKTDNNKNDFILGKIQHVDSAVPAWFVVSPIARSPAKRGVTH